MSRHPASRNARALLSALCVLLFFPVSVPLFSAPSLPALIDDTQSLVIVAHDVPALIDRVKASPWADTWNDDSVKKFLAPLRTKIRCDEWADLFKARTGLPLETLETLVGGDLLIAIPAFDTLDRLAGYDPQNPAAAFPVLLAAELSPDASEKIRTLMDALADKDSPAIPQIETYAGITLNTLALPAGSGPESAKPASIHWAISGDTFIASPHRTLILRAIDAQQRGGAERAFAATTPWLDNLRRDPAPRIFACIDFQTGLLPMLRQSWARAAKLGGMPAISPALCGGLGLDAIEKLTCAITLSPDSTRIEAAVSAPARRGIAGLIAFDSAPLRLPDSASAGWPAFSITHHDFPVTFARLEDIIAAANPRLHAWWQARLGEAAQNHSLNIRRDLIGVAGGRHITATVIPPGVAVDDPNIADKTGDVHVIELKDPRAFRITLAGLVRAARLDDSPLLTRRDYLGATIYTLNNLHPTVSIAVARNQLVVTSGDTSITESIVQNIINGSADPVASDAGIRAAFDAAPPGIRLFSAQDMRFALRSVATLLLDLRDSREFVDPDAIPPVSAFEKNWNRFYAWLAETSGGLNMTIDIPYKK